MSLIEYGYDSHWNDLYGSAPGVRGRVIGVDRGECDIATDTGFARVRTGSHDVCTGDWILADDTSIDEVLTRRTAVVRASAGTTSASQTLAANVDTVVVTVAADTELDLGRVERYLALAWDSGATPLVVLTKCDVLTECDVSTECDGLTECDGAADVHERLERLRSAAPGASVFGISAATGEGLTDLSDALAGTIVVIGPSGAGKSTLVNSILGREILATGHVRESDSKGRHTTVRRELLAVPGTDRSIIDTPGLRSVGLVSSESGVQQTFSDIEELSARCRFSDCAHSSEPGCAVRDTVDTRRIDSYHRLQRENHWATTRHDVRENRKRLAEAKQLSKLQRQLYRQRGNW